MKGALVTGTVLSLAVTAAWAWMSALTIGPVGPLHLTWRHPAASYVDGRCGPDRDQLGAVRCRRVHLRGLPRGVRLAALPPPWSREGTVMQSVKPWLAEAARRPGARLIWASTGGLAVLALATFYVSFRAQFTFMYAVKHQDLPALMEALIADVAMVVCSLLALGMACAGQSAKVARLLVVLFAGLSAGMNYLAADVTSVRSVAVYVMPPVVFAVCTDQTVAVIRRHGLGIAEDSAWTVLGRAALAAARLAGVILLYGLRFILAPAETATGLRRMVLNAAPLPGARQDRPVPVVRPPRPHLFPR